MITNEMLEREIQWEYDMADAGKQNYINMINKAKAKGREANTDYGQHLLAHGMRPVINALEAKIEKSKQSAGRDFIGITLIKGMDMKAVSYIALRCLIDSCSSNDRKYTAIAVALGKYIEDEAKLNAFESFDKKKLKKYLEHTKGSQHYGYKVASIGHEVNQTEGFVWKNWTASEKLHVGSFLIGTIIEATGLFKISCVWSKGRDCNVIQTTEKTLKWVEKHLKEDILSPWHLPMIIPPKPWTTPTDGGYYTGYLGTMQIVKTYFKNYLEELQNKDLTNIYTAVNQIQATPWQVNKDILNIINMMWQGDFGAAGLPPREDKPLPPCPVCGAMIDNKEKHICFEHDPAALKNWKIMAAKVHKVNSTMWSKRIQTNKIIWVANKCAEHEKIYFPHTLDFRGRIYATPMFLHPQGCDIAKGLLRFADGKPLGTTGAKWLAIHGANTFGVDKVSFDERVAWVKDNTDAIIAIAKDPLENLWWLDADSPYCFLAFCFEWAQYQQEGINFISHLPIALDGTCNGLQHFSAMLRDPVGGAAVNLMPHDRPSDIYQQVADKVIEKLHRTLEATSATQEDKVMAQQWLDFGISRKTVKRPVMVLPYGGTRYSCGDYLEEAIEEAVEAGKTIPWEDNDSAMFSAALFLSGYVWDAIGETLVGATEVMQWLQKVARLYNKAGIPVMWQTPSGMPVLQSYPEIESRRVKTQLLGSVIYSSIGELKSTIDNRKQVSGISPNFVHSMDASALVLTTLKAIQSGITDFAMIHDSYATHACDTEVFHDLIRNTFADMYSNHDVLQEFYDKTVATIDVKPPMPPVKGKLDIDSVRSSMYFFA